MIRRLRNTVLRTWRRLMKRTGGPLVVDLFAGPGGWDVGAWSLGIEPLGIEFDDAACDTRDAAGLHTLQADIGELDPSDFGPIDGLIASPPCQAFSMAGKGEGRKAIDLYCELIERYDGSVTDEDLAPIKEACADERAHLVLEPLRWAFALDPEWIALEQVKPVQPIWDAMKPVLEKLGYSVWTGVLSAECYGVPQTRQRAFLIASKTRKVSMPPPTHQRYIAPKTKTHEKQEDSLFDGGERGRVVHPSDRTLLPWVSMAEALGWQDGPSPSPAPSVTGGGGLTGGVEVFASAGARSRAASAVSYCAGAQDNAAIRSQDEPAPTIAYGHDSASAGWVPSHLDQRQNGAVPRPISEPAPTQLAEGLAKGVAVWTERKNAVDWVDNRPATTVVGSYCPDVISPPGYRKAGDGPRQSQHGAVRVTVQEAAILQSFPSDYPWQGSRTKQFQQVGNAVPPPLALAVLRAVVPMQARAAAWDRRKFLEMGEQLRKRRKQISNQKSEERRKAA